VFIFLALSSLALADPPNDNAYAMNSDEAELVKYLGDNCTGRAGEHPGACKIVIRDDGLAFISLPDMPTCGATTPDAECNVIQLNGGNPIKRNALRMGCTSRSLAVVSCTIALDSIMSATDFSMDGKPFISLMNFKSGTDIMFETETWLVTESGTLKSI